MIHCILCYMIIVCVCVMSFSEGRLRELLLDEEVPEMRELPGACDA